MGSSSLNSLLNRQDPIRVVWLRRSEWKHCVFLVLSVASLGVFYCLCILYPKWRMTVEMCECSAEEATIGLLSVDAEGETQPADVSRHDLCGQTIVVLEVKCQRYACSAASTPPWALFPVADAPSDFMRVLRGSGGQTVDGEDARLRRAVFGENSMQLPRTSVWEILARHVVHPFYLFQYFSVAVWCADEYYVYSAVIFLTTVGAIYVATREVTFNLDRLRELAGRDVDVLKCSADGSFQWVAGSTLLPGDRFAVSPGSLVPCDAVVVQGRVAVDESMLTGESVPITKVPLVVTDDNECDRTDLALKHAGNILFSGTRVIQTSGGVLASAPPKTGLRAAEPPLPVLLPISVVYKTGFRSAKGRLVASLLNPKEELMGFISDALMVILLMFFLSTALFVWTALSLKRNGLSDDLIFLSYLDALTIAIPPALTASLSVATSISVQRLSAKMISVSETSRVNWAGSVSVVCFDKTGTLTEDRLVFEHVVIPEIISSSVRGPDLSDIPIACVELMATCHSLSFIDGAVAGDALEVELLRVTEWSVVPSSLLPPDCSARSGDVTYMAPQSCFLDANKSPKPISEAGNMLVVLRHFEFSADKMRSTSLVKRSTGELVLYVKGSPEALISLVTKDSIPDDFSHSLHAEVRRGHRVIAMATHNFGSTADQAALIAMSQLELETTFGLVFMGLIALSNGLKADTMSTIHALRNASIHCSMITGDHAHTAIAVAESCDLLSAGDPLYYLDVLEDTSTRQTKSPPDSPTTNPADFGTEEMENGLGPISHLSNNSLVLMNRDGERWDTGIEEFLHMLLDQRTSDDGFPPLQLVMNGKSLIELRNTYPCGMHVFLKYCRVFARMKPTDKQFIVRNLINNKSADVISQLLCDGEPKDSSGLVLRSPMHPLKDRLLPVSELAYEDKSIVKENFEDVSEPVQVMFCGDGANDMSALREATVGVSLCEAETSVAAPITSRLQTPGAVVDVLKEGRCSLITAYVLISFNVMYAVIQLFMVCQMYRIGLKIGDATYLIQDLFFTLILGLSISLTPPSNDLSQERPPSKFLNAVYIFKLSGQIVCFISFQLLALEALKAQSWYDEYALDDDEDPLSETYADETSVISIIGLSQVLIASVVSTIGHPFRVRWYENPFHVTSLCLQSGFILYQLFSRRNYFLRHILVIKPLPHDFCVVLLVIMGINCAACFVVDILGDYAVAKTTCFGKRLIRETEKKHLVVGRSDHQRGV